MAGVELDGGKDGLTSRGSRGGSNGSRGNGGVGSRGDGSNQVVSGVGNRGDLGRPPGASDHAVTEVVGNVGDAVVAGLVNVGVAAGDTVAVGGSALLGGVVDVLVTVGGVAGLVLGSVLAAGHLGSNGSNSNSSRSDSNSRSSSNGNGSSSVVSCRGNAVGAVASSVATVSVAKASVANGDWVLGRGGCQGGGEQSLKLVWFAQLKKKLSDLHNKHDKCDILINILKALTKNFMMTVVRCVAKR